MHINFERLRQRGFTVDVKTDPHNVTSLIGVVIRPTDGSHEVADNFLRDLRVCYPNRACEEAQNQEIVRLCVQGRA